MGRGKGREEGRRWRDLGKGWRGDKGRDGGEGGWRKMKARQRERVSEGKRGRAGERELQRVSAAVACR